MQHKLCESETDILGVNVTSSRTALEYRDAQTCTNIHTLTQQI